MGSSGLEPPTSRLSGARSSLLSYEPVSSVSFPVSFTVFLSRGGGDEGMRTLDPLLAGQVLSQLSYTPVLWGFQGTPASAVCALKIEQQKPSTNSLLLVFL